MEVALEDTEISMVATRNGFTRDAFSGHSYSISYLLYIFPDSESHLKFFKNGHAKIARSKAWEPWWLQSLGSPSEMSRAIHHLLKGYRSSHRGLGCSSSPDLTSHLTSNRSQTLRSSILGRSYSTGISGQSKRLAFGPSYAILLAIVSGILGYGFSRATMEDERAKKKVTTYGSRTEFVLAERELKQIFPVQGAVSTDKEELTMYGSSTNS